MLFDSGKKLMAELLGRPLEPEEWFALIKKWDSGEVTNKQAALYLNIGIGWVCQLAGQGHLVRVRRGHVSLKSVEAWKMQKGVQGATGVV